MEPTTDERDSQAEFEQEPFDLMDQTRPQLALVKRLLERQEAEDSCLSSITC